MKTFDVQKKKSSATKLNAALYANSQSRKKNDFQNMMLIAQTLQQGTSETSE